MLNKGLLNGEGAREKVSISKLLVHALLLNAHRVKGMNMPDLQEEHYTKASKQIAKSQ